MKCKMCKSTFVDNSRSKTKSIAQENVLLNIIKLQKNTKQLIIIIMYLKQV